MTTSLCCALLVIIGLFLATGTRFSDLMDGITKPFQKDIERKKRIQRITKKKPNRFQRMVHVTLPNMRMIVVLMMVLALGNVLNAGFDQVYNLYSPQVYETGDILDTFIYRIGLLDAQFGVATAMGMFKSLVSTLFISVSYYCAYKFAELPRQSL